MTSFSRLRTQGPQTPGDLHELERVKSRKKCSIKLHTPVLFPNKDE